MITHLNDQNFQTEVIDYQGKVLVDFWAPWCGPCQMLTPIIEELSNEVDSQIKVAKLNTDESPITGEKYNITAIPAVLVFDHGQVKNTLIGFRQKQDYLDALK
ncbi:thioredoxin [Candidatus Shapirobacteria bacterium RBG_13_44_7]|uniref:Thioredoxin n=1 Tax=Candidatus Shapirobacteria bacterium RBG_13_44_7 TaxID=1802149 RepID=A0A1F7SG31_9BACT|nr:MAG: thioredoxin [Candidatus Shapirobacteria bacterium RBG_13_44_7]